MEHTYFAAKAPEIALHDGLVFVRPAGSHAEIALTPRTLQVFVTRANRILDQWHEGGAKVVPLKGKK